MNDIAKPFQVADTFKHLKPSQSLGAGISSGFTWIGYKAMKWSLNHEGENHLFTLADDNLCPYIDVVIVGMNPNISKMFYEPGTYTEDSASAPICASLNGDKPDPGVPEPQNPVCAGCKWDAWGSGQRKGKACQDHRKLAVLLLPWMTKKMLDKPLLEPVYLKVNPNSLKSLKIFGDGLIHKNIHYASIVTRITWDLKKPWVMNFVLKQALKNEDAQVVLPLLEAPMTKNIIGSRVEIYEEEQQPPAPKTAELEETGLAATFNAAKEEIIPPKKTAPQADDAAPAKRGPGRPRKPVPQNPATPHMPGHDISQAQQVAQPEQQAEASNGDDTKPLWDIADPEMDETVAKLTQQKAGKIGKMLT